MPSRSEKIAAERKQLDEDTKSELADIAEAKVEITALIDSGFLDHGPKWAWTKAMPQTKGPTGPRL